MVLVVVMVIHVMILCGCVREPARRREPWFLARPELWHKAALHEVARHHVEGCLYQKAGISVMFQTNLDIIMGYFCKVTQSR